MRRRHATAIVAGIATLLATTPLASVFESWLWLLNGIVAVVVVIGSASVARSLRAPAGVQVLVSMVALLLLLTWRFPSGGEIIGLLPSPATFSHFNELFAVAGTQVRSSSIPVPDLDGLLLLSTAGIGLVAVLVDLAAVGIRRPALAGLPMLALYSVPVAVLPDGVSFVSFALACAGFLWLLVNDSVERVRLHGRRFSGEGRDVEAWEPSPLASAGRRLGVVAIVAAIAVPLAVPAMTPTLMDSFGPGAGGPGPAGGGSGSAPISSVDMNAMLRDNLTLDDAFTMVIVHTDDTNPYYLRLGVAEELDNDGFHSALPNSGGHPVDEALPDRLPAGPAVQGTYHAQIETPGLGNIGLAPIYTELTGVRGLDGNWALDDNTDSVFSRRRSITNANYTIEYTRLSYSPTALRNASAIPAVDRSNAALTEVPANQYVADLVAGLTTGLTTEYDRVRALYEYFSPENDFRYALSTIDGESGSAIVDFLENKQGFCVQYAAALGWLVRQAGYPARVAFGFTRGSGRNGLYTLTNLNLHAWTEVYFPDFGWVPFDATPGGSVPGSARTAWAPDVTDENTGTQGQPTTGATGAAGQPSTGPDRGNDPGQGSTGGTGHGIDINPWHVVLVLAAILAAVLLVAPSLQRRARRRRRLATSGGVIALTPPPPGTEDLVTDPEAMAAAQRDAHNAWAELLDTMIDYGVLVDPAETPRAMADRLTKAPDFAPSGRPSALVLARAEERARYAPAPVRAATLDEAIEQARAAFAEYATGWERIQAALFPRSVLLWWRMRWYAFTAGATRRIGRARNALLSPLRRR